MSSHCPEPGWQAAGWLQQGRSLSVGTADLDRPDRQECGAPRVSTASSGCGGRSHTGQHGVSTPVTEVPFGPFPLSRSTSGLEAISAWPA